MKSLLVLLFFPLFSNAQLLTRVFKTTIDEETGQEVQTDVTNDEIMCYEFTWVGPVEDITNDTIAQSCDIYDAMVRIIVMAKRKSSVQW